MIAVALKGLAGRKVRALLTALAVVIGVSMVSGTFILTDTMQKSFDGLFTATYDKTDAVIYGQGDRQGLHERQPASRSRLRCSTKVRALPEVAAAGGIVSAEDATSPTSSATTARPSPGRASAASYDAEPTPRFSPLELKTGNWPQGPRQVVIDAGTAAKEHYKVGDTIAVVDARQASTPTSSPAPCRSASVDSLGFASIAAWDVEDRADAAGPRGPLRRDLGRARSRARRRPSSSRPSSRCCPPTCRSRTAPSRPKADAKELDAAMSIVQHFLLGFGGIALLVGAFVIFNTLLDHGRPAHA